MNTNRVLIIDDEPAIAAALRTRLEAEGYDVVHAHTGAEGIEAARREQPAVIVLDIALPDIDGMEVARRLDTDSMVATIPIIFLSGNIPQPARDQSIDIGGSFFLAKPFESEDVIRAIELVTRSRSTRKAA